MSQIKIPSGNDFVLELICMRQVDTETKDAFDISTCTNVSLNLYDETREDYVQLNSWALADGTTNVIRANVEGTALQPQTKYGLVITGVDENGENFKTRIRGRNFIYVVGSISDVTANDFITNPLTIQVTMNIQGELKPVNFDDLATVEVVDEKIAAAIDSIDLSDYATKNELQQTNEALSSESRTRSTVDQTLQSAVEAVGTNLSSNYYTKTQVDDIVSSITGPEGVTKEYVDNAVSDAVNDASDYTDEQISTTTEKYLSVSKYKDIPLTFHNPGSEAVKLGFGNFGVNPDSFYSEAYDGMTQWSIKVGDQTYTNICSSHANQGDSNFLIVEIPAGEKAEVHGIIENTHGWLSFVSNGELTVEGNLGSIFNDRFKSFSQDNYDRMFMHIENPQFYWGENQTQPIEVLQVKDFSHVYCDYTNYQYMNQQLIYGEVEFRTFEPYSRMREMFKNNEYVERSPIFINYGTRYDNNNPVTGDIFYGCVNFVEFTDLSIAVWHGTPIEPNEEYKCWTEGLTINLPEGCADMDKRYYQHMPKSSDDMVTINYIKSDLLTPYEFNGIQYALIDQFRKKSASRDDLEGTKTELTNKINEVSNDIVIDLYTNVDPFSITALDGEQHVYYYQCLSNVSPDELQNKNPITDKDYIEYCILSKTEYEVDAIDWESITWTRLTPQDGVEYNGEYYNHAILPLDITLQENERCYFRMRNSLDGSYNHSGYPWGGDKFDGEGGLFSVEGNVMSLMYAEDFIGKTFPDNNFDFLMFKGLFYHFILLSQAENLFIPVLDGGNQILMQMFDRCYSLETGPYCIALIYGGYEGMTDMYRNCGSLTKAYYLATNSRPNDTMFYIDDEDGGPDGHPNRDSNGRIATEGTIYINKNRTWDLEREAWCPENWTIVEIEPEKNFVNHFELKTYATQTYVNESVSGLASTLYVDDAIAAITGPDLSQYATQQFVNEAVSGLATESYVDEAVSGISGGVTQQYVDDAVSGCLVDAKSYTDDAIDARVPVPYEEQYLTIEALTSGTITFTTNYNINISYSLDNGSTWSVTTQSNGEATFTLGELNKGDKILIKAENISYRYNSFTGPNFGGTSEFNVYGNILSLLYGDNFKDYTYGPKRSGSLGVAMFKNSNVVSAEHLILPPYVKSYMYTSMFEGCTKLVKAPKLPATKTLSDYIDNTLTEGLTTYCYHSMFRDCTSLTTAPELPATTLYADCYNFMFRGCTNLKYIKAMFTTDPNSVTYTTNWVSGVAATGTFIKADNATWTLTGDKGVPSGWNVYTESEYNYTRNYELKPLLYNIEQISAANSAITLTLNANEYNKVYLVDYNAATPEYVTGDTTITLTGTADYNVSILKFKTDANFTSLTLDNQSSATLKWIGDDFTSLEANKEYEVMFEYTNGFELIVSWAEVSAAS